MKINDGEISGIGLIAGTQPVFMWCRMDVGAHHACWLLLQALFITASVPTATNTTATRTMSKGLFIVAPGPLTGLIIGEGPTS